MISYAEVLLKLSYTNVYESFNKTSIWDRSRFNIEGLLKLSYTNVYESFNKPPSPYTDDDHRSYCYCWAVFHTLAVCMKHHGLTIASRISRARHPQQAILLNSSGILIPVI